MILNMKLNRKAPEKAKENVIKNWNQLLRNKLFIIILKMLIISLPKKNQNKKDQQIDY